MKLRQRTYTNKDGEQRVQYDLKKLNEFGEGLPVDTKFTMSLKAHPRVREVQFTDKKDGKQKQFTAVNLFGKPDPTIDGQNNDYVGINVPGKFADVCKDLKPMDSITMWLQSFVDEDGNKKSAWKYSVKRVDEAPDKNSDWALPDQLRSWVEEIEAQPSEFLSAFVDEEIRAQKKKPQYYIDWAMNPDVSGTDYFTKFERPEGEARALKVFWYVLGRIDDVI